MSQLSFEFPMGKTKEQLMKEYDEAIAQGPKEPHNRSKSKSISNIKKKERIEKFKEILNALPKKEANLQLNMAKRIFFSLLSHLVPEGQESQIALTKGIIDYKALRHMKVGARELVEYGLEACVNEGMHWDYINDSNKGKILYNQAKSNFEAGNYKETINALIELYSLDWKEGYGGNSWKKIVETIDKILELLNLADQYKKSFEDEKEVEALSNMVAYVNVLDGLAHNTGTIMDKMINLENRKQPKIENPIRPVYDPPLSLDGNIIKKYDKEYQDKINKYLDDLKNNVNLIEQQVDSHQAKHKDIKRLMDSKELKDPDDVLQEVMPYLEKSDAPLVMKDWMHRARQRRDQYGGSEKSRSMAIGLISIKKSILNWLSYKTEIKNKIMSWGSLPDNKLLDMIYSNFDSLSSLYSSIKEFKLIIYNNLISLSYNKNNYDLRDLISKVRTKLKDIVFENDKFAKLISTNHSIILGHLENVGYYNVRKGVWGLYQALVEFEQLANSIE